MEIIRDKQIRSHTKFMVLTWRSGFVCSPSNSNVEAVLLVARYSLESEKERVPGGRKHTETMKIKIWKMTQTRCAIGWEEDEKSRRQNNSRTEQRIFRSRTDNHESVPTVLNERRQEGTGLLRNREVWKSTLVTDSS